MKVKIVAYTTPHNLEGCDNLEKFIAYCARVSNPKNQQNYSTSEKLLKYLLKHSHFSPFEMVNVVLEIETTRDIAHQILRHRSFSFQEFSQRYANPEELSVRFELRDARLQDPKNRQNSLECEDSDLQKEWRQKQTAVISLAHEAYSWAIGRGIAKEQARVVLPEGNTKTRLYMNGTLRSWIHYADLRSGHGTQKEHMDVALACASVIAQIFPSMNSVLNDKEIK